MIGKLKGRVDSLQLDHVILDVNGVGYIVTCSAHTLRTLPREGEAAMLLIETAWREDVGMFLYGFATEEERESFRRLLKVSGVGAKVALSILSVLRPNELASAIITQDKQAFKAVSGVGPKLAARLFTELKDAFNLPLSQVSARAVSSSANQTVAGLKAEANAVVDAISALTHLGYSRDAAQRAIQVVTHDSPPLSVEELIKRGLLELSQ